ncbi:Uncharacterised protein [Enterobacter kobei]|nr:Uncharacterised protein [Enterobacter kobei]
MIQAFVVSTACVFYPPFLFINKMLIYVVQLINICTTLVRDLHCVCAFFRPATFLAFIRLCRFVKIIFMKSFAYSGYRESF